MQPTRSLQEALHGECVDFYRNKGEEQDSNSFSISGTSQQRLHVTCPQTYLDTTVLPVRKTGMYTSLLYKAQIVRRSVCVCVCVCVFAFGGHVFCPFATEIGTHTRHAQGKVCVKKLKNLHRVPSRGVDPRVKFLDDANATHSSSFEHTPAPVLCRPYASLSFAKLRAIEYLLPTKLTLLSLSFLSKF